MDLTSFGVDNNKNSTKPLVEEIYQEELQVDIAQIQDSHQGENIERFLPWFIKYQLKDISTLPKTKAVKKIDEFFEKEEFNKGVLLVGMPGCGKTSTLLAYSKEYNYEVVELNASDMRSKKHISEYLNEIVRAKSLFNQKKLILIDEADGISGTYDRGGVQEIISIFNTLQKSQKNPPLPFCFTANKRESTQVKGLKKIATLLDFEEHAQELHLYIAQMIFKSETISYDELVLEEFITQRKSSDIRGFINDLQASCVEGHFKPSDVFEKRSYKSKIENLIRDIISSYTAKEAIEKTSYQDVLIDDIVSYLEEAIIQLQPQLRLKALLEISKADVFKKRIYKWQYWRYLVYIYFYCTYAQNVVFRNSSKTQGIEGIEEIEIKESKRVLQSWIFGSKVQSLKSRTKLQKSKGEDLSPIEEFAKLIHRSYHKTRVQELGYLRQFLDNEKLCEELEEKGILNESIKRSLEYCF